MNSRLAPLAAAIVIALSLSACNNKDKAADTAASSQSVADAKPGKSGTAGSAAADAGNREHINARNAYSRAYNALIDDNRSVAAFFKSYQGLGINAGRKSPTSFYGAPDDVSSRLDKLKAARATGSGDAQLDAAVDAVIASGGKLVEVWGPLHSYFHSKGFLEDNWAKAKANDAAMTAGFQTLIADIDKLGDELDRVQDAESRQRMDKLKAEGNMLAHGVLNSMDHAKKFVKTLEKVDGLRNKEAVAKANAQATEVEAALAELSKAMADEKQKTGKEVHYDYGSLKSKLESMIGQWRVYKELKQPATFGNIIKYYNDAVGVYNGLKM